MARDLKTEIPSVDEIFKLSTNKGKAENVVMIPLNEISNFPNHPFKVERNEELEEMVESIKNGGVRQPVIVRAKEDGGYEMVSGHRRKLASEIAGLNEIPAIIRELTRDEATILMVDSNIQREKVLPSEKAFAYKMKMEALKHQGKRNDLTSTQNDTETIFTIARKNLCQFATLKFQQLDGLNTAIPFGVRKIDSLRTLTTESLAVFMPFRVQKIRHNNGIYYGQNVISKNMIIADRKQLLNGNSFILGVSGSGKSFTAKQEIITTMLRDKKSDIVLIDPENEYSHLVKALGGEVIKISATSPNHINAMDMNSEYGDGANPVILKSEFILSLCEQLIGSGKLEAKQKSIIDRCTASVYRYYQQGNYQGTPPTLKDFYDELLRQNEPEAKDIALAIELFVNGSLNTFAKETNVDTNNRLICYDILELGKQLLPIGMLVVLDSILNRITRNRAKGRNTFIFIDEIYLLFQHEYSANFLFTLWKRVRKYGAFCTGLTQNLEDMLQSHTARTMLANSELIVMLNQASTDRIELAKLLNISDLQMSYITNVNAGEGLIKIGSSLIPFVNKFPKNTKLYELMNTKLF